MLACNVCLLSCCVLYGRGIRDSTSSLCSAAIRDSELAKFEAFLSKLGGSNTRAMVRGRQRLAYPISKCVFMQIPCLAVIRGGKCVRNMMTIPMSLMYEHHCLRRFWEGIYVLYDYSAPRTASQQVQKYLSTPIAGNELNILRCVSGRCRLTPLHARSAWLHHGAGHCE